MARKPNYRFERFERVRKKEAKKAERVIEKQEKAAALKGSETSPPDAEQPEENEQ